MCYRTIVEVSGGEKREDSQLGEQATKRKGRGRRGVPSRRGFEERVIGGHRESRRRVRARTDTGRV